MRLTADAGALEAAQALLMLPDALLTALGCETREGNVTYSRAMETVEANRQYLSESALAVYESLLNE